jgi:hypothetical protein
MHKQATAHLRIAAPVVLGAIAVLVVSCKSNSGLSRDPGLFATTGGMVVARKGTAGLNFSPQISQPPTYPTPVFATQDRGAGLISFDDS